MKLYCPQGMCNVRYHLGVSKESDASTHKAIAQHTTHSWPLWAAVTRITVSPTSPVRLVKYIGTWMREGQRGSL